MIGRRTVIGHGLRFGLAAATTPLWNTLIGRSALAQSSTSSYKAVLVISLVGGNDGNNVLIPLDPADYQEYSTLRSTLAIPASSIIPLPTASGSAQFGFHPSLKNVASLYSKKRASVVVNIGPLGQPATKQQLLADPTLYPQALLNHFVGQQQWESATTSALPSTGWGGRVADRISSTSGSLPPVLNTSYNSIFTVGSTVQAVAVQSGSSFPALSPEMNAVILQIAQNDSSSPNKLVAATAQFRANAMSQQAVLNQAMSYGIVKQTFTNSALGASLGSVAQLLAGRSVIGAQRQLFYAQQIGYDTHQSQLPTQAQLLSDLDTNLGTFFNVLDDLGLSNSVLVCTHSDFARTITSNVNGGSDHAWGSHQLILGGGITGGQIIGKFPTLELGGPDDYNTQGIWIPSLSVTQLTGSIGSWLGLDGAQLAQVFPDLANFPAGIVSL